MIIMANILKAVYEGDNFRPNSKTYSITVVLDGSILVSDINLYLPNNGSRYNTIENTGFIPSNSTATILSADTYYVCVFIAENGSINAITQRQEGIWKCIGKKSYL
jgi:hypothetical protein